MDKKEWCVKHVAGLIQGYLRTESIGKTELFQLVRIIESEINIMECRELAIELGDLPNQLLLLQKALSEFNAEWMEAKLPVKKRYIDNNIQAVKYKMFQLQLDIDAIERKYKPVNFFHVAGPTA